MTYYWFDRTNPETGRHVRVQDEEIGIRVYFHVEEFQIYTQWFQKYDYAIKSIEEWLSEK